MNSSLPSPETTLVIILGASQWPYDDTFQESAAFAKAAEELREYFRSTFKLPETHLLWLFNTTKNARGIDEAICSHIEKFAHITRDIILYYVGHGQLTEDRTGLYLAIYDTHSHNPESSSLRLKDLARTLKTKARYVRRFYILDCCFSAAALADLQAATVIDSLLQTTFEERGIAERGFAALCSSGKSEASVMLPDHENTFFTAALLRALLEGNAQPGAYLSLKNVYDLIEGNLLTLYKSYISSYPKTGKPPKPQIYMGDIATIPLFPNPGIQEKEKPRFKSDEGGFRPGRRLRIFLCHASEDKPVVRTIYERLQAYNVELWFDEQNLLPGERWEYVIPGVIQNCDIVLICLSRAFLRKEGYAHYEVHIVLEAARRKPPEAVFHIPFRLDDCTVPAHLAEWHYVSNFVPGDFEKVITACEKRRVWLNTHQDANIEPLRKTSAPSSITEEVPQGNPSGQRLPGIEVDAASQHVASDSSRPQSITSGMPVQKAPSSQRGSGTLLQRYDQHAGWVLAVAWEPGGERIASAGADGTVRLWEAETGRSLQTYHGHTRWLNKINLQAKIFEVAWSSDGQRLASAGDGATVHVWSAETGHTLTRYEGHVAGARLWPSVYTLAWSPDGQQIASACSYSLGRDTTMHIWDAETGQMFKRYNASSGWLPHFSALALAWSPDGTALATACENKTIRVWDTRTDQLVAMYHSAWSSALAWSPDGCYLAAACADGRSVCIWERSAGTEVMRYQGHTDMVRCVAWSPDGRCLATAANDGTVRIWEALTGKQVFIYGGHANWVTAVSWSGDGTRLASASNDNTVHVWLFDNR